MPVGRWVMRTALSVVFTDWPPGPLDRNTSMRRSFSSIWMSTSSASGSTATGAGAHLQDRVLLVRLVLRQQHDLDLLLQPRQPFLQVVQLLLGKLAHLGVAAVGDERLEVGQLAPRAAQRLDRFDDRRQVAVLL